MRNAISFIFFFTAILVLSSCSLAPVERKPTSVDLSIHKCILEKYTDDTNTTTDRVHELQDKSKVPYLNLLDQSRIDVALSEAERTLNQLSSDYNNYVNSGHTFVPTFAANCNK